MVTDAIASYLISEVGIVSLFVLWVLYQVYSPGFLPDTKFQEVTREIKTDIEETKQLLISSITVLRAVVRTNEEVDTEKVDEYLVENGVGPDDFIHDEDPEAMPKNLKGAGDD